MRGLAVNRNVAALAAFNLFRGLAVGGYMALMPLYMNSVGYDMSYIGGAIAFSSIVISFWLPAIGYFIDVFSKKKAVVVTASLMLAALAIPAYTASLPLLTLSYTLFLASFLTGQPARMAFLASSVDEDRLGSYIGITSSAFSGSRMAGPLLGGLIVEAAGYRAAFTLLAALVAASTLFFAVTAVEPPSRSPPRRGGVLEVYRSMLRPSRGDLAVYLYIGVDRASWSLWFPLLSAYLGRIGLSESQVGAAISAMGLIQTLLLPLAGRLVDAGGAWASLTISEVLGIASAIILSGASTQVEAVAAAALAGVSIALWVPGYNALIARISGHGLGESYSVANTVRSAAGAPSPYIGGLLYDHVSPAAPFIASASALVIAALMAATTIRRVEVERRARGVSTAKPQKVLPIPR